MKTLSEIQVFWDNGEYVAVVEDAHGVRRNLSHGSRTRREALRQAREILRWEKG